MSSYEVLGRPFPGIPAAYRGVSRATPLVQDDLGLQHPANQALLQLLERQGEGRIGDLPTATRLLQAVGGFGDSEPWEVVEITRRDQRPVHGRSLLGYDVCITDGTESLLASTLLWTGTEHHPPRVEGAAEREELRNRFLNDLNGNLLFATAADAERYLEHATRLGPWEGPDIEWSTVGLWLVST